MLTLMFIYIKLYNYRFHYALLKCSKFLFASLQFNFLWDVDESIQIPSHELKWSQFLKSEFSPALAKAI